MNHLHHVEEHFTAGPTVGDVVIGMSDGLTVPFALAAAYIAGGLIPLLPYMLEANARAAITFSALITLIALCIFGFVKGRSQASRRSVARFKPRSSAALPQPRLTPSPARFQSNEN